jgi:hypothetical protein
LIETDSATIPAALTLPTHELENRRTLFGALSHYSGKFSVLPSAVQSVLIIILAPLTGNDMDMMFSLPPLPEMETYEGDEYIVPSSLEQHSQEILPQITEYQPLANGKELVPVVVPPSPEKTISKENFWDKAVELSNTPQVCTLFISHL